MVRRRGQRGAGWVQLIVVGGLIYLAVRAVNGLGGAVTDASNAARLNVERRQQAEERLNAFGRAQAEQMMQAVRRNDIRFRNVQVPAFQNQASLQAAAIRHSAQVQARQYQHVNAAVMRAQTQQQLNMAAMNTQRFHYSSCAATGRC